MLEPQVAALADVLRVAGLPEEGDELRRGVVEQVEKLVVQWVAQVGVAGGLSEEQATTAGANLLLDPLCTHMFSSAGMLVRGWHEPEVGFGVLAPSHISSDRWLLRAVDRC